MGTFKKTCRKQPKCKILKDLTGKTWRLGSTIGTGGFGEIRRIEEVDIMNGYSCSYVAKLEKHTSGPLFVERNCYLRIANLDEIQTWKRDHYLPFLGMPHYVASGSYISDDEKYRFLILPRYKTDLEKILKENQIIGVTNVLKIAIEIINVLEYIHDKGYVHNDIKASNIMLDYKSRLNIHCRRLRAKKRPYEDERRNSYSKKLRSVEKVSYIDDIPYLDDVLANFECCDSSVRRYNEVYLLDFGLASKFLQSNGEHVRMCRDERRAHAGTILFCSRDAHEGMSSRRSDLECLGYNIVYWLTGRLPWSNEVDDPEKVAKMKQKCFRQLGSFLKFSFQHKNYSELMLEYFEYIKKLQFEEKPNYEYLRNMIQEVLLDYGDDDPDLDFKNFDNWKLTNPKTKPRDTYSILLTNPLKPISSNISFKRPKLRKKLKNAPVQDSMMNWSKILADPEIIIKQSRERKISEECETFDWSTMDFKGMNPTYAMTEYYCKVIGKRCVNKYRFNGLPRIEGYTPIMMYLKSTTRKRPGRQTRRNNTLKSDALAVKMTKKSAERRNDSSSLIYRNRRA